MLSDSPDRAPPAARGAGRASVGHPIDVASGTVTTDVTDYVIPGSFPLRLERGYSSGAASRGDGLFGPGWSSPFESWIAPSIEGFVLFGRNGDQQIPFDTPTSDEADRWINFAAFRELRTAGDDLLVIEWQPTGSALATSRYVRRDSTDVWWLNSIAVDRRESIEIDRDERGRIIALRQQRARRGYRIHLDRHGREAQVDLVANIDGRGDAMTGTTIA